MERKYKIHEYLAQIERNQSWLSRKSGVSRTTINEMVVKNINVKLETLERIAWTLGVTPLDLLEYVPDSDEAADSPVAYSQRAEKLVGRQTATPGYSKPDINTLIEEIVEENAELYTRLA